MRLIIEDEEGRKTIVPFSRDEISIGRLEGNTIRLTERNVSRRHARLVRQTDAIVIEDLGSYNGVRVNGERVDRTAVRAGDVIEIGDYDLAIDGMPAQPAEPDTNPNARAGDPTIPPPSREESTAVRRAEDITNPNAPAPGRPLAADKVPKLVGMAGSFNGREFKLPTTNTVVGRDAARTDVAIDHDSVSRQHARFVLDDGTWTVISLEHDHPVKVNGIASDHSPIASGDTLEIGALKFRFTAPFGDATFPGLPLPGTPSHPPAARETTSTPSRTPMIVGGIVVIAALAVVVLYILPKFTGTKTEAVPEMCLKGQGAMTAQDWAEAVSDLSLARQLNLICPFDIDKLLKTARQNLDAQDALQNARRLSDEGKYREALKMLDAVPANSEHAAAAKLLSVEIQSKGVQKLSEDARHAIDSNNIAEATGLIEELRSLDSAATTLPLLIHDRDERKKAMDAQANAASMRSEKASARSEPTPVPPKVAPSPAVPAPERTIDERNQMADAEINDAVHLIMTGDFQGGMERLQSALAESPDKSRVARIHKNMGVAYTQKKQPADAVPHLKIYLKLQADAPDRAKFEGYIKQFEARGGK